MRCLRESSLCALTVLARYYTVVLWKPHKHLIRSMNGPSLVGRIGPPFKVLALLYHWDMKLSWHLKLATDKVVNDLIIFNLFFPEIVLESLHLQIYP